MGLIEIMYGGMDGNRFAFNLLRTGDGAVWVADFGPPASLEIPTAGGWGLAALALLLAASAAIVCGPNGDERLESVTPALPVRGRAGAVTGG